MANEKRIRALAIGGLVEDNPLAVGGTTLTSAGLAALPAVGSTEHAAIIFDPDGIYGAPEIAYVTAHTAAASTATIARGQEGTTARQHDRDVPWVHGLTVKDFDGAGGGVGLLAEVIYRPASQAVVTTTSTTHVDVDGTNLAITFTAPPSGTVNVVLSSLCDVTVNGDWQLWGLRQSTTILAPDVAVTRNNSGSLATAYLRVTGLTPGTSYTYKWAFRVNSGASGSARMLYGGTAPAPTGPATMRVEAVNV